MDQLERLKIMLREQHPLTHDSAGIPQEYAIVPRKGVDALIAAAEALESVRSGMWEVAPMLWGRSHERIVQAIAVADVALAAFREN